MDKIDLKKYWFCTKLYNEDDKVLKVGQIVLIKEIQAHNVMRRYVHASDTPIAFNPANIETTIYFLAFPDKHTTHNRTFRGILSEYFQPVNNEKMIRLLYEKDCK